MCYSCPVRLNAPHALPDRRLAYISARVICERRAAAFICVLIAASRAMGAAMAAARARAALRPAAASVPGAASAMPGVTVTVRQGALRGCRKHTPAGKLFFSFEGIPYARPPLGSLRFKAPVAPEPWSGIRDASKPGNACVHIDERSNELVGDEDCLYLNVYTPSLPASKADAPRAVLFWIHGGGFHLGSSFLYQPERFIEQDVVLVTFHYRLGPLGFLGLGTTTVPGNAGLKDQTMALRWVKDNISVFGGDPDNVTIFGESAGGASVHFHVISPLSKGLFRRAIAQSGSALCPWTVARDPVGRAHRLAVAAGCPPADAEDPQRLLAFFREVSPALLCERLLQGRSEDEVRREVKFTFVPCVEPPKTPGAFLPQHPEALMASAQRVPIMFGLTSHEGILFLPEVSTPEKMEAASNDMERFVPFALSQRKGPEGTRQVAQRLKDFYLQGKPISKDTLEGFVHMQTDVLFARDVLRTAATHARLGVPVFLFKFSFVGELNFLGKYFGGHLVPGACHADELGYLFNIPGAPDAAPDSREAAVCRRMTRMWADFARTGNPTPAVDDEITASWPQFSESAPNYMEISDDLKTSTHIFKERMQLWDELHSE